MTQYKEAHTARETETGLARPDMEASVLMSWVGNASASVPRLVLYAPDAAGEKVWTARWDGRNVPNSKSLANK